MPNYKYDVKKPIKITLAAIVAVVLVAVITISAIDDRCNVDTEWRPAYIDMQYK